MHDENEARWQRIQRESQQRQREHDEQMRRAEQDLQELRQYRYRLRIEREADEARRQLQEAEARYAEQMRINDEWNARRQRQAWNGVIFGAASIGATLALASPFLFPQLGQGKEGEEEEKKAAHWSGTILVETVDGKSDGYNGRYVRMNLPEFVAALFNFEDFQSEIDINFQEGDDPEFGSLEEQRKRLREMREELVSFVASDRNTHELKHFQETGNGGDIKVMRETWPDIVRLQAPLLLSVSQFRTEGPAVASGQPARPYDDAHPFDQFHTAMHSVIQAAGHIIHTVPIHERSMKMRGGSMAT